MCLAVKVLVNKRDQAQFASRYTLSQHAITAPRGINNNLISQLQLLFPVLPVTPRSRLPGARKVWIAEVFGYHQSLPFWPWIHLPKNAGLAALACQTKDRTGGVAVAEQVVRGLADPIKLAACPMLKPGIAGDGSRPTGGCSHKPGAQFERQTAKPGGQQPGCCQIGVIAADEATGLWKPRKA
jgi:hypothetical protein